MGILLRMGRPVAVWGHLGPEGRQGRSPASCGGLGASGPPRAVRAALRRPVAVWGASGPRGPSGPLSGVLWRSGGIWAPEGRQGRSPASCGGLGASGPRGPSGPLSGVCGGLGASGPRGPSGPLSGVLWRSGGIWAPRAVRAALRRPVAVWGHLGPEGRQGRSPASCGGLGASGFLDWNFLGS